MYVYGYICMCMYVLYVCMHVCMYIYVHVCVYMCIYIYVSFTDFLVKYGAVKHFLNLTFSQAVQYCSFPFNHISLFFHSLFNKQTPFFVRVLGGSWSPSRQSSKMGGYILDRCRSCIETDNN